MVVLYEKTATTFEDNGICVLDPSECVVTEVAGGEYELDLEHPLDDLGKHLMITEERLIKAPVPPTIVPEITLPELKVWITTTSTPLYSRTPKPSKKKPIENIIQTVKNNPVPYLWTRVNFYNHGAVCLWNGTVYKCRVSGFNYQPDKDRYAWIVVGSINDTPTNVDHGTIIENLAANTRLYLVAEVDGAYIKVRTTEGKIGFVLKTACEETVDRYQQTIPQQTITEQVFRVYEVSCDEETMTLQVKARHISYDFQANCLYDCKLSEAEPNEAIAIMQSALMEDDRRLIACDITGEKITKDWSFKNPVNALLDPDDGLVPTLKARLVRNNGTYYILHSANNSGITIEYGVNLLGVNWTRSIENVITRVLPRSGSSEKGYVYITNGGKISSGTVQDQGKNYVESEISDQYTLVRIEILNCSYTEGQSYEKPDGTKETYTEASVKQKMLADALERFTKDNVDGAEITLDVEFVLLGDTEEYKQYRGLQTVSLYDVVKIKTGKTAIEATAQVTEYEYDSLRKRYNSIRLGTVNSFTRRIPGYRVVNGSVTYDKLSPDLINRIVTQNESASSDAGGPGGTSTSGDGVSVVDNNSKDNAGIVAAGSGNANKVWKTDADGNPAWRDDASSAVTVVDNLTSTSATDALSAKQGKVLNEKIIPWSQIIEGTLRNVVLTIPSGTSGIIMVGLTASVAYMFYYNAGSNGNVTVNVLAPSGATLTTDTNKVSGLACGTRNGTINAILLRGDTFPSIYSNS